MYKEGKNRRNFIAHLNGNGDIKTVFMSVPPELRPAAPGKNPRETRTLSFSFAFPRFFYSRVATNPVAMPTARVLNTF